MYEEYMRDVLGYTPNIYSNINNTYDDQIEGSQCCDYQYRNQNVMPYNYTVYQNKNMNIDSELEKMYPDIYNIVYPMVKKACMKNTRVLSRDVIDEIVDDIYRNIEEDNNDIELNINLGNETRDSKEVELKENKKSQDSVVENRQRPRRNPLLNDLIRILVLRELIGRPGCFGPGCFPPNRPPMPGPGPRPGPRPPFPRVM